MSAISRQPASERPRHLRVLRIEPSPAATEEPRATTHALEPANAPEFTRSLRGYDRAQVDAFVDDLRQRLALMRARARRAETELARLRDAAALAGPPERDLEVRASPDLGALWPEPS